MNLRLLNELEAGWGGAVEGFFSDPQELIDSGQIRDLKTAGRIFYQAVYSHLGDDAVRIANNLKTLFASLRPVDLFEREVDDDDIYDAKERSTKYWSDLTNEMIYREYPLKLQDLRQMLVIAEPLIVQARRRVASQRNPDSAKRFSKKFNDLKNVFPKLPRLPEEGTISDTSTLQAISYAASIIRDDIGFNGNEYAGENFINMVGEMIEKLRSD